MSSKEIILAEIKDLSLKEKLAAKIAEDWTLSWTLLDAARNPKAATTAQVAVLDDETKRELFGKSTTVVFSGRPSDERAYFKVVAESEDDQAAELLKALKLAFAYRDTTRQNIESLYPDVGGSGEALESMAHALKERICELEKLSDMRLALIDQMPAGVIGIDDEGIVALANREAISILGMEDVPIWGMEAATLFNGKLAEFLSSNKVDETALEVFGQRIAIRKSPFTLENRPAGTILTLLRLRASTFKAG